METINNNEEVIIKPIRVKKLGNYKYPDGCKAHYKTINYMNEYHKKNKVEVTCLICHTKTFNTHLKQHQKTKKCLNTVCV